MRRGTVVPLFGGTRTNMNTPTMALTRRSLLGTAGSAGSALALAACGAQGTQAPASQSKAPVSIRVIARTVSEQDMWPIRVPALEAKYPNIKINLELIPPENGGVQAKTDTFIAAGEILDVVHTHFSAAQPQRLYLQKAMRELDSFVARDKVDLKQWYPQAIDAGRIDGKVIAFP